MDLECIFTVQNIKIKLGIYIHIQNMKSLSNETLIFFLGKFWALYILYLAKTNCMSIANLVAEGR